MKIAILTPTFHHFSGIDRVAEQQALDYAKKKNKVTVITLESSIKPYDFNIIVLGMPKSLFMQRIYRLLFFLDRQKISKTASMLKGFDVVISHFYPMNWIASCAKRKYGVKYVYHNHGVGSSTLFGNFFERMYMKIFVFLDNISLKNADEAVSISRFMQSELKKESGLSSTVVYDRIDTEKFHKGIKGGKIRKKLGVNPNEKLLFFIGRLSPHKNVHGLLDIFSLVRKKLPDAKLLIAGKPTFHSYYKTLRKKAGSGVIFKDFIEEEELPCYYAACDLYVTASLWEGFNLPLAEAQACGKKVVAFDVCSHPEVVKNGILIKKDDVEGFAQAVIRLLNAKK